MPLLAYDTRTGPGARATLIPDFQSRATEAVLIANALRAGVPRNSIEVRELSPAQWRAAADEHFASARAAAAQAEAALDAEADALAVQLGIDTPEKRRALARLVERG